MEEDSVQHDLVEEDWRRTWRRRLPSLLLCLLTLVFFCVIWSVIDLRPMHHDEANQAYTARRLLDWQGYFFRPEDHHGPTLYFVLLPVAWLRGVFSCVDLDIATVRLVPLLFSCAVLLLPLGMGHRLGRGSGLMTGLLLCFSPCFCFYSGYFIQEMLLVCFVTLAMFCGWRWWESRERLWSVLFGISVGLCVATKETWVICGAAAGMALLVLGLVHRRQVKASLQTLPWKEVGVAALCALAVDLVLFSSFFTNPGGIIDFFRCWSHYFIRGTSSDTPFAAPFHEFLRWLFWFRASDGEPLWSEWPILVGVALALLQLAIPRLRPRGLRFDVLLFFLVYAVTLTLIYSLISYKTPWCALGMLHAFALVAGMGYAGLAWSDNSELCLLAGLFLGAACMSMTPSWKRTMVDDCTDERNPFAYAHTQYDYLRLVELLQDLKNAQKEKPRVLVMTNYIDAWPLPWYTQDEDGIVYVDFRGWKQDQEVDRQLAEKLKVRPQVIVCNEGDNGKLPKTQDYVWKPVTVRPRVTLQVGVLKGCPVKGLAEPL